MRLFASSSGRNRTPGAEPSGADGNVALATRGDPDLDLEAMARRFWLTHIRIGFGVFLAESLVVAGYLALTPHGAHRTALWVMVGAWIVAGLSNLLLTPAVAAKHWRTMFSAGWTIVSLLALGGVVGLDGGVRSPLVVLLFLPIGYAAWAFTPGAAAACGGCGIVTAVILAVAATPGRARPGAPLVLFGVLAGAAVLSVSAARNRSRRERREARLIARIAELASIDELTGCVVRRVFHQRLHEELARCGRYRRPLALLMIDLDRFKEVNDTYGHLVGDNVLAAVGATLRAETRSFDVVGRLGGDEFGVLMPDTRTETARAVAERLSKLLQAALEVPVTLSIGISGSEDGSEAAEQLLDEADFALYQVKRGGRNGIALQTALPRRI